MIVRDGGCPRLVNQICELQAIGDMPDVLDCRPALFINITIYFQKHAAVVELSEYHRLVKPLG